MTVEDFKFKFDPVVQAQIIQRCWEYDKAEDEQEMLSQAKRFCTLVAENCRRGIFDISTNHFRCWSDWGKGGNTEVIVMLSMKYRPNMGGLIVKFYNCSNEIMGEALYDNLPNWMKIHLFGVVRWKRLRDKDHRQIQKSFDLERKFYERGY